MRRQNLGANALLLHHRVARRSTNNPHHNFTRVRIYVSFHTIIVIIAIAQRLYKQISKTDSWFLIRLALDLMIFH